MVRLQLKEAKTVGPAIAKLRKKCMERNIPVVRPSPLYLMRSLHALADLRSRQLWKVEVRFHWSEGVSSSPTQKQISGNNLNAELFSHFSTTYEEAKHLPRLALSLTKLLVRSAKPY